MSGPGRVVVTGATSQIGFFLLPRLLREGYEVLAVSRRPPVGGGGKPASRDGRLVWAVGDLTGNPAAGLPAWDVAGVPGSGVPDSGAPVRGPAGIPLPPRAVAGRGWTSEPLRATAPDPGTSATADADSGDSPPRHTPALIHLAPLWLLSAELLDRSGARRVIAFGSTSRFSKEASSSPGERALARRLAEAEARLASEAEARGIAWTVFRPTLVYGCGRDQNVARVARLIRRYGVFPLAGEARGLRQPVHADDLAAACVAALGAPAAFNRAYDLSGGETLSYRAMVAAIARACGRRPRLPAVPVGLLRAAIGLARHWPGGRDLTVGMAERMNQDLCFDHAEATRDFGYRPRAFDPVAAATPSLPDADRPLP